jgi:hypothetical protein
MGLKGPRQNEGTHPVGSRWKHPLGVGLRRRRKGMFCVENDLSYYCTAPLAIHYASLGVKKLLPPALHRSLADWHTEGDKLVAWTSNRNPLRSISVKASRASCCPSPSNDAA